MKMNRFFWKLIISIIVCICVGIPLILIKVIFGEHVLANFCLYSIPSSIGTFVALIVNKEEK